MEKCTFCVQKIRRTKRDAKVNGFEIEDGAREINPACVNSCNTEALIFGDMNNPESKISRIKAKEEKKDGRGYHLMEHYGTSPNVLYLKKVDNSKKSHSH
jgi:molybdopterin-containing oxidoreductase family iron-sulfur binding subunit